jgi:hypothetical protein
VGHFSTGDSGQFCTGGYTAKPATVSLYNQALLTGRLKHYVRRCWVASGGLDQRLALWGIDVAALLSQGLYVQLDAGETLSEFMVDGWPSEPRFNTVIGISSNEWQREASGAS